ncbi:unnamed protein product [Larinioides sclopetarius]|uniref:carbonic anhydrase n=1 Tax=Larinioides sclopetarius TaxID=280406 RepID=A0AAV2BLN9_9ARAC
MQKASKPTVYIMLQGRLTLHRIYSIVNKNMLKIFIVYLLYLVKDATMRQSCDAENQYYWSYHGPDNGPSYWKDLYPACNGTFQSPIAITADDSQDVFPELKFYGFDKPITKAKVQNLGWTVMITPEDDVDRYINWFNANFNLRSIRFHFGSESNPGAEHVISGVRYPMEIYYYMEDNERNTTAILSTLMDVADEDNSAFGPIIDVLPDVTYRNDFTKLQSELDLSKLLPENIYHFYTYEGSISVPPCKPLSIRWILKDVGKIGGDQLNTFMTLYSVKKKDASDQCLMGPNFRPVQDLGSRRYYNAPYSDGV